MHVVVQTIRSECIAFLLNGIYRLRISLLIHHFFLAFCKCISVSAWHRPLYCALLVGTVDFTSSIILQWDTHVGGAQTTEIRVFQSCFFIVSRSPLKYCTSQIWLSESGGLLVYVLTLCFSLLKNKKKKKSHYSMAESLENFHYLD